MTFRQHGSVVAFGQNAVLIEGRSGAGKSALALQLMALGARLVADDQVLLSARDGAVWAQAPERLFGLIEARGVGILTLPPAQCCAKARVKFCVSLDTDPTTRLPKDIFLTRAGVKLPLLQMKDMPHAAATLKLLLTGAARHDAEQPILPGVSKENMDDTAQ